MISNFSVACVKALVKLKVFSSLFSLEFFRVPFQQNAFSRIGSNLATAHQRCELDARWEIDDTLK